MSYFVFGVQIYIEFSILQNYLHDFSQKM